MPAVTIRNLSDATHRALKVRAAQHGRSAEAEMRDILEMAVRPDTRLRLGTGGRLDHFSLTRTHLLADVAGYVVP